MSDREPIIAAATIFILLLVWIGGMIEPSHGFAGSAMGGIFAVTGTFLLLMPLSFAAIKRIDIVKKAVVRHISMKTILIWHIYAGFLGTILILLHTGHKFGGVLATTLTALTLGVLFSGVIGRYLQRQIGDDVRDKRKLLNQLYEEYDNVSARGNSATKFHEQLNPPENQASSFVTDRSSPFAIGTISLVNIVNLVSSIADVESAITSRETLKQWFTIWFRAHVALIIGMYLLLILHIWSGIHFGLRWLQ
jgi:hypothetical protein